jgi:GR25 family glycosyltransferase involved in LPS biosynthesis
MPRKFTRVNRKGKLCLTRKRQRGGSQSSLFKDAYVISADINSDRYKDIEKKTKIANLLIKHWKATVINKHDSLRFSLPLKGIGKSLFSDRTGKIFNLGSVGCFLSHRTLLEHIANINTGTGTLILEDDAEIFPDVLKKISDIEKHIPGDWDILFLDKWGELKSETPIYKNIVKIKKTLDTLANWGTHSYIVKNSSIKTRIIYSSGFEYH